MMSFAEKYRALRNCANWNEQQAADYFRKLRRTNNFSDRNELRRNADRHTKTAIRLNQVLASV